MRPLSLPVSGRADGRFRTLVSAAKNPVPGAEKVWWRELRLEAVAAGCALRLKSVNVKKWNQGWESVDESKLARNRTRTKDREYAVVAARGGDHDLEQALFQSVAAVARASDHEQRFASLEVMRCRPREQLYRQRLRQARQYGGGFDSPAFHGFSLCKATSKLG